MSVRAYMRRKPPGEKRKCETVSKVVVGRTLIGRTAAAAAAVAAAAARQQGSKAAAGQRAMSLSDES